MYNKRTTAVDPGSRNLAIAQLRFAGYRYDAATTTQIPLVTPLHLELWNVKGGICLRNSAPDGGRFERCSTRVEQRFADDKLTEIDDWIAQMNHFIVRADWIFERDADDESLSALTVENQCDHIKTKGKRWDMFLLSNIFASTVDALDKQNAAIEALDKAAAATATADENPLNQPKKPLHYRVFAKSAAKYGIKSDGELQYGERKLTSVEITRELFRILGLTQWLVFLDSVEASGQKIDDLCDAFLLGLQYAIDEYEASLRKKRAPIAPVITAQQQQQQQPLQRQSSMLAVAKNILTLRQSPVGKIETDVFPRLLSMRTLDDKGVTLAEETFFPENCGAPESDSDDDSDTALAGPIVPRDLSSRVKKPARIFGNYVIEPSDDLDANGKKKRKPRAPRKKKDSDTAPKPRKKPATPRQKKTVVLSRKRKASPPPCQADEEGVTSEASSDEYHPRKKWRRDESAEAPRHLIILEDEEEDEEEEDEC